MKKTLNFLFFLFLSVFAGSQTIQLSGTVLEDENLKPLSYATVVLTPGNKTAVTDLNGEFALKVSPGTYLLKVHYLGFRVIEMPITIDREDYRGLEIRMMKEPYFLSGIEVVGDRRSNQIVQVQSVTAEQLQLLGTGEVGEVLRSIPNVSGVRKGGAVLDPVVRGFKYSQLGVYIDGLFYIEGGCPNRMDPTVSRVDAHDIERIEVIKGPYALKYGPNFGGVIRLVSHNPVFFNSENPEFRLNAFAEVTPLLGMREHVRFDAGNNKNSVMFFGGKTDFGNFADGNGDVVKMQVMKYNFGLKTLHRFSEKSMLKLTYNNLQGRNLLFAALPMDERSDNTWFAHADYLGVLPFNANKSISLSVYYASVEHIMDNYERPISDTVAAVSTVYAQTMGAKFRSLWQLNEQSELTAGFDVQRIHKDGQRVKTMIMQPPTAAGTIPRAVDQLWNNAYIDNVGLFGEWNMKNGRSEFFASTRLDMNMAVSDSISVETPAAGTIYSYGTDSISSSFINLSAAAGYSFSFTESLALSFAVGRGVRSPDMLERYIILLPVGYDNFDYIGNPALLPEVNNEADITLSFLNNSIGNAQITVFYSYVQNFITGQRIPPSQQKPLSSGVLGVKQFVNAKSAIFTGFEFGYSTPVHRMLVFSASAAWTAGTIDEAVQAILDPDLPVSQQVIGDTLLLNDPLSEIPPFEANAFLKLNLWDRKMSLSFNSRMIAPQNRVSIANYEQTTPGTVLFNVTAMYKFSEKLSMTAGVYNLLDEYYYEHLNRRMIGSLQKIYEPGRRFFINLSVNL
jgi:iron complex outermembrane recepter protein